MPEPDTHGVVVIVSYYSMLLTVYTWFYEDDELGLGM